MDDIQKVVEQDAMERREVILAFCKEVCGEVRIDDVCDLFTSI